MRAAAAACVEPVEAVDKGLWPSDGEAEEGGWSSCDGEEEEEVGEVSEAGSEAWLEQHGYTPLRTPQHGCTPLGWRGRLAEGEGEEEGESEEEDYDGEEEDGIEGCVVEGCGGGFEAALPPDEGSTRSSTPLRLHESPSSIGLPPTHDALFDDADDLDGGAGRLKVELSRRLDEMVVAMDTGSPPAVTDLLLPADLLPVGGARAAPCPAAEVHEVTRDLDGEVDALTPATASGEEGLEVGGGASGGWLEYLFGDASNELIGGGCCVVGCSAGGCGACAVGGGAFEDAATWEAAGAAAAAAATAATGTAAEAPEAAAAAAAGVATAAVTVVAVAAAAGMVTRRKKRSAVGAVTCADETCGAPPAKSPRSKKRPRGRAPSGKSWNCVAGMWESGSDAAAGGASASAPTTSEWPASATPQAPPVLVITLPAAARAPEATAPASPSLSCARAYSPAVRDGAPVEPPQLPPHSDLRRDLATLKAATVLDAEEAAAADAEQAAAADAAAAAEAAEAAEAEVVGGLPELLQSPSLAGLYVIVGRGAPASGGGDKGLACPPCRAPPEAAAPPPAALALPTRGRRGRGGGGVRRRGGGHGGGAPLSVRGHRLRRWRRRCGWRRVRRVGRVGRRARAGRAPHAELAHRVGGGRVGGEPLGRRLDRVDAHRHRGRRGCPALAAALRAAAPALPPGQPPAERRRAPPLPRTAGAGRADALCARLTSSNRRRGPATVKQQPSPGARDGCRARSLCRKRPKRRCGRDQMVRTLRAGRSGPRSSAATPPNREMVFRMPAFFVRCVSLTHEGCREWCLARSACLRAFEKSICGGSCGGFVRFRRLRGVCVLQLIYRVTTRAVPFLKLGPGTSDRRCFYCRLCVAAVAPDPARCFDCPADPAPAEQ